jgi:hypothetical protein
MRRCSNLPVQLAVAAALAAMSGAASAAAPTLKEVLDASGVTVNGYVSASYQYADTVAPVAFRNYDIIRNGFQIDQAGLQVGYLPKEGFGAFVNVIAGEDARLQNTFETRDGAVVDSSTFNLTQAYVQYAGNGFTAIAGKFVTLVGAEVIDPRANFNFSRSLLFAFEPSTHVGARVTVPIGDTFQVIGGINNGFNNISSSGSSKLGEVGVVFSPSKAFTLSAQGYFGRDLVPGFSSIGDPRRASRQFANFVATFNATEQLTFVLTADYQQQDLFDDQALLLQLAGSGVDDEYTASGAALYVNYKFTDQWRVALRGEYLDDQDGFITALATGAIANGGAVPDDQTISDITLTLGYSPAENYELRFEVRVDTTDDDIFTEFDSDALSPEMTDSQTSVAFQALYKF